MLSPLLVSYEDFLLDKRIQFAHLLHAINALYQPDWI
jgi:hypothetical protein